MFLGNCRETSSVLVLSRIATWHLIQLCYLKATVTILMRFKKSHPVKLERLYLPVDFFFCWPMSFQNTLVTWWLVGRTRAPQESRNLTHDQLKKVKLTITFLLLPAESSKIWAISGSVCITQLDKIRFCQCMHCLIGQAGEKLEQNVDQPPVFTATHLNEASQNGSL